MRITERGGDIYGHQVFNQTYTHHSPGHHPAGPIYTTTTNSWETTPQPGIEGDALALFTVIGVLTTVSIIVIVMLTLKRRQQEQRRARKDVLMIDKELLESRAAIERSESRNNNLDSIHQNKEHFDSGHQAPTNTRTLGKYIWSV